MANYLEGIDISRGDSPVVVGVEVEDKKDSNFDNLNGFSVTTGGFSVGFGTSGGPGSKPAALHTEYASGASEGPAYGTQDIVFYLQRADMGANDDLGQGDEVKDPYGSEAIGAGAAQPIDVGGATGPNADSGQIQSGANQIGMGASAGRSLGANDGGTMAPMSGMDFDDKEDLGAFSQNASYYVDVTSAVQNATKTVESLGIEQINYSLASSEKMFTGILNRSFSPDIDLEGVRDEEKILDALSRPSTSDLAFLLARAARGMIRVKDVVRAVNDGSIGAVTPKSKAFQSRIGSTSKPKL
jgi:hypothetical protein